MNVDDAAQPLTVALDGKSAFLDTVLNPMTDFPGVTSGVALPASESRNDSPDRAHDRWSKHTTGLLEYPEDETYEYPPGTTIVRGGVRFYQGYTCWFTLEKTHMRLVIGRLRKSDVDAVGEPDPEVPSAASSTTNSSPATSTGDELSSSVGITAQGPPAPDVGTEGVPVDAPMTTAISDPIFSDDASDHTDLRIPTHELLNMNLNDDAQPLSSTPSSGNNVDAFVADSVLEVPDVPEFIRPQRPLAGYHFLEPNQVKRYHRRSRPYPPPYMMHRFALQR